MLILAVILVVVTKWRSDGVIVGGFVSDSSAISLVEMSECVYCEYVDLLLLKAGVIISTSMCTFGG